MRTHEAVLTRLRTGYPGWRIWRSTHRGRPAGWVATNRTPTSDRAPTLHADTPEDLERQLQNPPQGYGIGVAAVGNVLADVHTDGGES